MDFMPKPKRSAVFPPSTADDTDGFPASSQDPLVASAMEEDQARKRAKKSRENVSGGKKRKDGLTLEQVEELEGGTIKESKAGMAATQRADKRRQKAAPDETGMLAVDDLEGVEEVLERVEDDGITLEPFNLAKEREEGHFDEGGNYVENREEEDASAQDAWLTSDEAKVLSDDARQRVESQQARMASAEEAPSITPQQTADLFRKLVEVLNPRETVTKALKRLRPPQAPAAKRAGRAKKENTRNFKDDLPTKEMKEMAMFDHITEISSTLMDAGELDVYSIPKEEFDLRARKYPPITDDVDMFGTEPAGNENVHVVLSEAQRPADSRDIQAAQAGPSTAASVPQDVLQSGSTLQAVRGEEADYSGWPVKELSRFLKERGVDPSGMIEKADLVKKVAEIAAKRPEGEQPQAPLGYVWDPSSNYFYSNESGMYYDASSGAYFASDGKWYQYDESSSKFVERTQ